MFCPLWVFFGFLEGCCSSLESSSAVSMLSVGNSISVASSAEVSSLVTVFAILFLFALVGVSSFALAFQPLAQEELPALFFFFYLF
ncbi:hypothetical protein BPO_1428 [Bergeyella porcorum]|uniref:Uncharacterized protein n=1 Tax=Bergeyella porcorum TaxID=1735111 RepID=A0AAU0F2X5_9FLAO